MKYIPWILVAILIGGGIFLLIDLVGTNKNNSINQENMNTQEFKGAQTEEQLAMAAAAEPVSEKNLENGLVLTDIRIGEGPEAKPGQEVVVNYIGTFPDGTKFDTSYNHSPNGFEFPLGVGRVIQGWDQGVAGMRVGGLRKLIIPPTLGYGANDSGPIPGGSTLHFTVELLKVGGN